MAEAISTGHDFDKGAKILHAGNGTIVDTSHFHVGGECIDHTLGMFRRFLVGGSDRDGPILVNLDDRTGLFLDRANILATRSNQGTDLFGIDLELGQLRGVGRNLIPRLANATQHRLEDIHPGDLRLLQRGHNDLLADPVNLEIQLDTGDPVLGTGNLEVHIAEVILVADNVGQQNPLIVRLLHHTDGDTRHRLFDFDASGHQGQRGTTDRGHRR